MANEKKVVFSGEGSALLKLFDQINSKRKELGLNDEKFAKVSKENANVLLKDLQSEIRERERLIKIKKEEEIIEAKRQRNAQLAKNK